MSYHSHLWGGGIQPKVLEVIKLSNSQENIIYDDYNSSIRADQNTIGTLTTNCGSDALRNGYKVIEKVQIKQATKQGYAECEIGGVADLNYPDSKTRRGRVIRNGTVCPTLMTGSIPNVLEKFVYEIDGETYLIRIRKLTPLECWRLMGFTDEDFNKAASVNSNTQLYKQAGNSIVKQVLMAVFSQMLTPETQIDNLKRKALSILELL